MNRHVGVISNKHFGFLSLVSWFSSLGLSLIPVYYRSKKAAIPWKKYQFRRAHDELLKKWFVRDRWRNIAVICGRVSNNLVVLDADHREVACNLKKYLPETLTVNTSRGRKHFYYFLEEAIPTRHFQYLRSFSECLQLSNSSKKLGNRSKKRIFTNILKSEEVSRSFSKISTGPGKYTSGDIIKIDLIGQGGYVLAPPSCHPNGYLYQFDERREIATVKLETLENWITYVTCGLNYKKIKGKSHKKKTIADFPKGGGEINGVGGANPPLLDPESIKSNSSLKSKEGRV